uniref:CcmFc n=1 Tax=Ptychomnion cygnisetum TaxID=245469 RepID=A0A075BMP1_9BRYO|nr:cytochrome c biogenesis factor C [Ptychomnion cygnisetum]AGN74052.1 cytochrome c biogenesis factor C [Ptychomnion cygnisetum]AHI16125.1 CcmFc [Ptychomnion cygnisetum]
MVQLQNFFFLLMFLIVLCGTAAPILFQWSVSRDVPTGAPSFHGTIIPIFTSLLLPLVHAHSRGFIRSMEKTERIVLVRAKPILLLNIIEKSSPKTRAKNAFFFFFLFNFSISKFMGDLSYLESFCGVLCFSLSCTFFLSFKYRRDTWANEERRHRIGGKPRRRARRGKRQALCWPSGREKQRNKNKENFSFLFLSNKSKIFLIYLLQFSKTFGFNEKAKILAFYSLLALPQAYSLVLENIWNRFFVVRALSKRLMDVDHDFRKVPMTMKISHGGVCISIMGVILSNTKKRQFTQLLPSGSELHIGREHCCLRGIDQLHGPTFHSICGNLIIYKPSLKNKFIFDYDESFRGIIDLLPIAALSYQNEKVEKKYIYFFSTFFHGDRSWRNREHHSFPLWLTLFPEKRFSFSNQETSTTKVAIHSNLFTDLYALIGTGSFETGWYITIMKLPFIFCIWIGFILASLGGSRSFRRQLALYRLDRN